MGAKHLLHTIAANSTTELVIYRTRTQ